MPGFGVSGGDRPEQRADDSASAAVVAPHGKSSIMEVTDGEECMPTPIRWSACQMVANVDATLILLSFGTGTGTGTGTNRCDSPNSGRYSRFNNCEPNTLQDSTSTREGG